ncbi:MAG: HIT domain-containing protein [Gammaproteobacteria bacterium]|nr:HIT domain-containing protein [Gammaproteobacteria bacterium]MCW8922958.1 HIT domain-containing protein [Gammaproteobacteria bacterium]
MTDSATFKLDPKLEKDCYVLGRFQTSRLLLLNNSLVPWFILVPETSATELYELPVQQQQLLLDEINMLSNHLKHNFTVDKLNVAAIGNIVSQLHIHVVGRHFDDFCWPDVVWGAEGWLSYDQKQVDTIKSQFIEQLPDSFTSI